MADHWEDRSGRIPLVKAGHNHTERIGDAILTTHCHDSAWVLDHPDCAVCLLVDQYTDSGGGRHALMRMDADQAVALGEALIAAALDQKAKAEGKGRE